MLSALGSSIDLATARIRRVMTVAPTSNVTDVRLAEYDGRTYLDLADKDWRAVQIGPEGWQVVTSPPVRFRRACSAATADLLHFG